MSNHFDALNSSDTKSGQNTSENISIHDPFKIASKSLQKKEAPGPHPNDDKEAKQVLESSVSKLSRTDTSKDDLLELQRQLKATQQIEHPHNNPSSQHQEDPSDFQ